MSVITTNDFKTEVEYRVTPVKTDGVTTALKIERWITKTPLGPTGRKRRGADPIFEFEDIGVIDIKDVAELTGRLFEAVHFQLNDTERGRV